MNYKIMRKHGRILNGYYKVKQFNLKNYTVYNSNCMTLWKKQNYGESKLWR